MPEAVACTFAGLGRWPQRNTAVTAGNAVIRTGVRVVRRKTEPPAENHETPREDLILSIVHPII